MKQLFYKSLEKNKTKLGIDKNCLITTHLFLNMNDFLLVIFRTVSC